MAGIQNCLLKNSSVSHGEENLLTEVKTVKERSPKAKGVAHFGQKRKKASLSDRELVSWTTALVGIWWNIAVMTACTWAELSFERM